MPAAHFNKKRFILLISYLFYFNLLFSQNQEQIVYKQFTPNEGLASLETYTIKSDRKGYIWIGTDRGINKFDGKKFITYTTKDGLTDNFVNVIFFAPNGDMWVLCGLEGRSLCLYKDDHFIPFEYNDLLLKSFSHDIISVSFINNQPRYFGLYWEGIWKLDAIYKKLIPLSQKNLYGNTIYYYDKSGLFGSEVNQNGKPGKLLERDVDGIHINFGNSGFTALTYYYRIYVSKRKKTNEVVTTFLNKLIVENEGVITKIDSFKNIIQTASEDNEGNIWLAMNTYGVFKLSKNYFEKNDPPQLFFDNIRITGVCQDIENGYWFSTLSRGLIYVPDFSVKELPLPPVDPEKEIIGKLCNGYENGLIAGFDNYKLFLYKKNWSPELMKFNNRLNAHGYIKNILYDKRNNSIAFSQSTNVFTYYIGNRFLVPRAGGTSCIAIYNNQLVEAKRDVGLLAGNKLQSTRRIFTHKNIFCVFVDNKNTIWAGAQDGLYYSANDTFVRYNRDTIKTRVTSIKQLSDGIIVAGLLGEGILLINGAESRKISFPGDARRNMVNEVETSGDTVFAATQFGVVYFKAAGINNITPQYISPYSSFPYTEIKSIACSNNRLYVLSPNKILSIDINAYRQNTFPPKIKFTKIVINDKSETGYIQHAVFKHNNRLRFEFNGVAYRAGEGIVYKYRLFKNEKEEDWKNSAQPFIEFGNIAPGNYLLEVKSINENNIESEAIAFSFRISSPFWQTWQFYLLASLVAGILSYIWYYSRLQKIKKANKMRELLLSYEQQALSSQINPHFIFNVITNIQNFILQEDKKTAYQYLGHFAKLMRLSLDNSRLKWAPLDAELELIKAYLHLEALRFNKFDTRIDIDPAINTAKTFIPGMLIQPYLENSIIHGIFYLKEKRGLIKLSLQKEADTIKCTIEDNGVGRKIAAASKPAYQEHHTSAGQSITQKRLELLMKEMGQPYSFKITDIPGDQGVIVQFNIPFKMG